VGGEEGQGERSPAQEGLCHSIIAVDSLSTSSAPSNQVLRSYPVFPVGSLRVSLPHRPVEIG